MQTDALIHHTCDARRVEPASPTADRRAPTPRPQPPIPSAERADAASRPPDLVDFSDYLQRLNAEQRLRRLAPEPRPDRPDACDTGRSCDGTGRSRTPESATLSVPSTPTTTPSAAADDRTHRTVEDRYLRTSRAATGRLIDMLM